MTTPDSFFNEPERGRGGVPRDGRGRALLVPRGVYSNNVRVPYSSASGLADYIADDYHIVEWKMYNLAIAMGRNRDLADLAAVEPYHTRRLEALEPRVKRESKFRLKGIIERALDRQRVMDKADFGTVVHAATEPGVEFIPEEAWPHAASFAESLRVNCITVLETEQFTVTDETMTAGTFDHAVRVLGHPLLTGYVIADKKTGAIDPFHWEVQIATYALGDRYDVETDERSTLAEDINLDWGLVFHIDALTGVTTLYLVDLQRGWRNATMAAAVRDAQAEGAKAVTYKPATFDKRLEACNTKVDLRLLWDSTHIPAERDLIQQKASTLP